MQNIRFSDYVYTRPDADTYISRIRSYAEQIKSAGSAEETLAVLKAQLDDAAHFETLYQVAYIRNSVDTSDPFYQAEMEFFNEVNPTVQVEVAGFNDTLLASPFLDAVREAYGDIFVRRMDEKKRLSSRENIPNQIEENKLIQEYFQVAGNCSTEFRGENMNFYGLLKQMQSPDREIRKAAMKAWSALYASVADKLDDIYSRMITVRCRMAKALGLKDYTEMMYLSMERFDYGREEIAAYREKIRTEVVPLVAEINEQRRQKLGLDQLHYYDESIADPTGNVVPEGTAEEMVETAREMYRELSPETGKFFDFMVEHYMFDLVTGPTKQQGGYCTFVPDFDAPFIFSNFNGTTADIDVLTHEAGHSFESFTAWRAGVPLDILFSTSEVAEIHSMSMEFFTHPYMEKFFGGRKEDADRYRLLHLQDSLRVVPYMAAVDEFQHEVYAREMTSAEDRYTLWHALEQKYMPWRDYDGDGFLEKGGFWLQKQHIFMCPFYYIDYSLAQMCAFEFYLKDLKDHKTAWADYMRLCRAGGSQGYFDLLKLADLKKPFDPETLSMLMRALRPMVLE